MEKQASSQRIWWCNTPTHSSVRPRRVHDWWRWVTIHINAFLFWYCFISFSPPIVTRRRYFLLSNYKVFLLFLCFSIFREDGGGGRGGLLPVDEGEGEKERKKTSCQKGWAAGAANCGSVRVRWITKKPQKRAQLSNPKQAIFEWNSTIWDCNVDCFPPMNLF